VFGELLLSVELEVKVVGGSSDPTMILPVAPTKTNIELYISKKFNPKKILVCIDAFMYVLFQGGTFQALC